MLKLTESFKPEELSPYLIACPHCGATIPKDIRVCWDCGAILDPKLRALVGVKK